MQSAVFCPFLMKFGLNNHIARLCFDQVSWSDKNCDFHQFWKNIFFLYSDFFKVSYNLRMFFGQLFWHNWVKIHNFETGNTSYYEPSEVLPKTALNPVKTGWLTRKLEYFNTKTKEYFFSFEGGSLDCLWNWLAHPKTWINPYKNWKIICFVRRWKLRLLMWKWHR